MATLSNRTTRSRKPLRGLNAILAGVVTFNFTWVLFDLSYVRFRDLYFRYIPVLTTHYDPVKGIEPHRETTRYLELVTQLKTAIAQKGLTAPDTEALLTQVRDRSTAMIVDNPFQAANKSGSLEKIKNSLRKRLRQDSSREAFRAFWTTEHLQRRDSWRFFERQIQPLIATNYYRHIDESGEPVDFFWKIDLCFSVLFALELLSRTWIIRKQHHKDWIEALLWRWYDLILFLPVWRFLRLIPTLMRLHQVGWINLTKVQNQLNTYIAGNIVGEVTELVLLQTLGLVQTSIRQGALQQLLMEPPELVDINQKDELELILQRLLRVLVEHILPQIRPELALLIEHAIQQSLLQAPLYKDFRQLPGVSELSAELSKQVGHQATQTLLAITQETLTDEIGQQLTQKLVERLIVATRSELRQQGALETIEPLLADWLEEVKITVLQRLESQDQQQTLREAEHLRWLNQTSTTPISAEVILPSPKP
jgi:hypothetical protein